MFRLQEVNFGTIAKFYVIIIITINTLRKTTTTKPVYYKSYNTVDLKPRIKADKNGPK